MKLSKLIKGLIFEVEFVKLWEQQEIKSFDEYVLELEGKYYQVKIGKDHHYQCETCPLNTYCKNVTERKCLIFINESLNRYRMIKCSDFILTELTKLPEQYKLLKLKENISDTWYD